MWRSPTTPRKPSSPSAKPSSSSRRARPEREDAQPRSRIELIAMRSVVVTGLGMVTPLGCGTEVTWKRLLAGTSGAAKVEAFDVSDLACKIACAIPRGTSEGAFNADDWMEPKEQRKVDPFIVYAMTAATQALEDAGWKPATDDEQTSTGVLIGSGVGGPGGVYEG